jgi:hypothetical protein
VGKPEGKRPLGRPSIVGKIILNGSSGSRWGVIDWIDLSQDRDRWWALVNTVMNLQVP